MATASPSNSNAACEGVTQSSSAAMRSDFKDTITIIAGEKKVAFTVHEDVLCARSSFFAAACSRDWKENITKQILLPKAPAFVFKAYLLWAYFSNTDFAVTLQTEAGNAVLTSGVNVFCFKLCHLWILADYLGDAACKNEAVKVLVDGHARGQFVFGRIAAIAKMVCQKASKESALRRWVVDAFASTIQPDLLHSIMSSLPQDFGLDVFKAYTKGKFLRDGGNRVVLDTSHYYE